MTTQERFQAAANLFLRARGLPADKLDAFVAEQTGTDEALRAAVRDLLMARDDADLFESLAGRLRPIQDGLRAHLSGIGTHDQAASNAPDKATDHGERPNAIVGHYRLLQRIGEGGFGEVWVAEQREPVVRRVALKIIKLGMDTRQVIARFEAERQALALMDHPHIAKVFDAGATSTGRPYFVMELCIGDTITAYCDRHQIPISERLQLFVQVCQAVQHAHQKGVIHRDIKPSNVLVSTPEPGAAGLVKVIDFGIAKATSSRLTDKTLFTAHDQLVGTPQYMSPEQAEGSMDIDTRTDVYSLGVLLYELLTGVPPHDPKKLRSAALDEMRRIIRDVEPPKPSTRLSQDTGTIARVAAHRSCQPRALSTIIRGDLDWITLKAMDKDRTRRYESASALAADIVRHVRDEPIVAGQPGAAYRLRKFVRRKRSAVLAAALVTASLIAGITGTTIESVRARRAQVDADRNAAQARLAERQARDSEAVAVREREIAVRQAYSANMLSASDALERGQTESARYFLTLAPEERRGWEWRHMNSRLHLAQQVFDLGDFRILQLHVAPDGKSCVAVVAEGFQSAQWSIRRWDLESGKLLRRIPIRAGSSHGQLVGGGNRLVLQAGDDPTGGKCAMEVWDLERGTMLSSSAAPAWVAVAPDGTLGACLLGETLQLLDVQTGAMRVPPATVSNPLPPQVTVMCFSPDRRRLAISTSHGDIQFIDLDRSQPLDTLEAHSNTVAAMEFSADSTRLLTGSLDGSICIWDVTSTARVPLRTLRGHVGAVWAARFSPDESLIASTGIDRTIRLWNTRTGSMCGVFQMPTPKSKTQFGIVDTPRTQLAFVPDGQTLLSTDGCGTVHSWDVRAHGACTLHGHHSYVYSVHVSPNGTIYSGGWDGFVGQAGSLRVWDSTSGEPIATLGAPGTYIRAAALTRDGARLAICRAGEERRIDIIDTGTGTTVTSISEQRREWQSDTVDSLAVDPAGRRVFWVNHARGMAQLADAQSGAILMSKPVSGGSQDYSRVAWSHDGRSIATCNSHELTVELLRADSLEPIRNWPHNHSGRITFVCFSPDDKQMITSGGDGIARVWEVASGAQVHDLIGHTNAIYCAQYSPDGKRIATGGNDGNIRIWDAQTFDPVARLGGHEDYVYSLAWRSDSEMLVSGSGDHTVHIWDTVPANDRLRARRDRQACERRVEPIVQRLFAELKDARMVVESLHSDKSLTDRARQVACEVALRMSLQQRRAADDGVVR